MREVQDAAERRGEKAGRAGLAERRRLEAMGPVRATATETRPVPAPPGVWMVAVAERTEVWWAVRPRGDGFVEVWDGRAAPRVARVVGVDRFRIRRSRLRLRVDGEPQRVLRVREDRGEITAVGQSALPWYRQSGGDDPIAGVVLILAGVWGVLTLPVRIRRARARARTRAALIAALGVG